MIHLVCYTRDSRLARKCSELFGADAVLVKRDLADLERGEAPGGDVVVVDLKYYRLPMGMSFAFPLIVLVELPDFAEAVSLLPLGVRGYGNRMMRRENLWQVVESVASGQLWMPPEIILRLIDTVGGVATARNSATGPAGRDALLAQLSPREQEVAACVADGLSNQEIAEKLFVSLRTVKAHLSSIYDKTGLRSRLELGVKLSERLRPVRE